MLKKKEKEVIGFLGYGHFAQTLATLLSQDFKIKAYDPLEKKPDSQVSFTTLKEVLQAENIFIMVPINHFSDVLGEIAPKLSNNTTVIDVCSVKIYPVDIMKKVLPKKVGIIATHPLFGPESFNKANPLKIVMNNVRDTCHCYNSWKNYFSNKKIKILEMTPDQHDRLIAQSQALTHFVARALKTLNLKPTTVDTVGYETLLEVMEYTCKDSWDLFIDMQRYNPYTKKSIHLFLKSCHDLEEKISNTVA